PAIADEIPEVAATIPAMAIVVPVTVTVGNIRRLSPEKNQGELIVITLNKIDLHGEGRSGNHGHRRLRAQHPSRKPSVAMVMARIVHHGGKAISVALIDLKTR